MSLNSFASLVSGKVNPNVPCTLQISEDYTTDTTGLQIPIMTSVSAFAQVQATENEELRHIESLNIQGVVEMFYLNGDVEGVERPFGKGGDLITFGTAPGVPGTLSGTTWKVFVVFERWATGWVRVGGVLQ